MSESIRQLLHDAAEVKPLQVSTSELWEQGRAAKRRRTTVTVALTSAAAVISVGVALTLVQTVSSPSAPDSSDGAAPSEDQQTSELRTKEPRTTELSATVPRAKLTGIKPPTRETDGGRQTLISSISGDSVWISTPPWFNADTQAVPDLPAFSPVDPQTPRTYLTVLSAAEVARDQCPQLDCVVEHSTVETGVGDWRVVADSPNAGSRNAVTSALSFTDGPAGYIRVVTNSPDIVIARSAGVILFQDPDEGPSLTVNPRCAGLDNDVREGGELLGNGLNYSFCLGGYGFSSRGMPREETEEYAASIIIDED